MCSTCGTVGGCQLAGVLSKYVSRAGSMLVFFPSLLACLRVWVLSLHCMHASRCIDRGRATYVLILDACNALHSRKKTVFCCATMYICQIYYVCVDRCSRLTTHLSTSSMLLSFAAKGSSVAMPITCTCASHVRNHYASCQLAACVSRLRGPKLVVRAHACITYNRCACMASA